MEEINNNSTDIKYAVDHLFKTKLNNTYNGCGIYFNGKVYQWNWIQRKNGGWSDDYHPADLTDSEAMAQPFDSQ